MNKPDWKDAPEWAQWLAMDECGTWCWFAGEPNQMSCLWMPGYETNQDGNTYEYADCMPGGAVDWKLTLERRP